MFLLVLDLDPPLTEVRVQWPWNAAVTKVTGTILLQRYTLIHFQTVVHVLPAISAGPLIAGLVVGVISYYILQSNQTWILK